MEHLLVGALSLYAGDEHPERLTAQELFARAHERGMVTAEEYEVFDKLRRHRNPHGHQ